MGRRKRFARGTLEEIIGTEKRALLEVDVASTRKISSCIGRLMLNLQLGHLATSLPSFFPWEFFPLLLLLELAGSQFSQRKIPLVFYMAVDKCQVLSGGEMREGHPNGVYWGLEIGRVLARSHSLASPDSRGETASQTWAW